MRIARVLTRLNLGGPARQVLAADPILAARGHEVRVLAGRPEPGEGDLTAAARERGIDVVRVPGLRRGIAPAHDLVALARLKTELRRFRPDVLHTHASKAGALGRRAARGIEHLARVHTFHGHVLEGYFARPISERLARHERRLARTTDRVVAVSHATAEDLLRLGVATQERLVVVPPGVELDALLRLPMPRGEHPPREGSLRSLVGAEPDDVLVGVVGRLAPVKRPERALDVFELLAGRYPGLHLAFVGDGVERRRLERRIRALPPELARRAHLVGAIEDVTAVFRDLDVLLATSAREGLPVAMIEAGAAGLPVVATAVGGVPEIVAHERTGWLGETTDELAFGLARYLDAPAERDAAGRRARLRVRDRHSAARLADRLEELYSTVLEELRCAS